MEDVKELLEDAALEIYVEVFENLGYDSLDHLLKMDPSALLDLKRLAKMKEGHFVRLQTTINNWSVHATPSTASAPTTPRSVGPAEMGPLHMGPAAAAMGPSRAMNLGPTTDLGPTGLGPTDLGPSESMVPMVPMVAMGPNPREKALLKTYKTWKEARIVSLNYSTQAGASAMQSTKCGGNRKILGCRSVLSKKFQDNDGPKCPHYLLWTKDKSGDWKLNLEASTLRHKDFCISGQLVRKAQLIHDPEFVKAQKLGKNVLTGKEAAKLSLGFNGRMDGSVKDYTARRARNTIKHYDANDYEDDWCKLNHWGHQFVELNHGSFFDLQKDDEGRLVILLM